MKGYTHRPCGTFPGERSHTGEARRYSIPLAYMGIFRWGSPGRKDFFIFVNLILTTRG